MKSVNIKALIFILNLLVFALLKKRENITFLRLELLVEREGKCDWYYIENHNKKYLLCTS